MKLYFLPASPNSRYVALVAKHLQLPMEFISINLQKGEGKTPEFLKMNPNGKVPTLADGDFHLWESNAIAQYLAEKKPDTLYPTSVKGRADVNRWLFWQTAHWNRFVGVITWENALKQILTGQGPDAKVVATAEPDFQRYAEVLNHHLEGKKFVVGDKLTIADFALAAPLMYWKQAKIPLEKYKHMLSWFESIEKLDAWKQSDPQKF